MNFKDFIPPVWFKLLKRLAKTEVIIPATLDRRYEGGYDEEEVARIILEKTRVYRDGLSQQPLVVDRPDNYYVLLGILLASTGQVSNELRVIDFGGGSGVHYFFAKAFFGNKIQFRWHVVETRALVETSRVLENSELRFFDNFSDAAGALGHVDLMHSSGTLQCTPDPYSSLKEMIACDARMILLSRTGLTLGTREVSALRESSLSMVGPGPLPDGISDQKVMVPFLFGRKAEFDQILGRKYEIRMELNDGRGRLDIPGEPLVGLTYVAERRPETENA